ncbi:hypothetical protein K457DRAFT_492967 [Linnemannia elongata AG-77]|uniref:Uncharacterized protein n=1 Tax=Linnemannia elongata AG-77 TaxID=1314771 RepID=A0A197KGC4_9FUNG|nr:hypothetical protein K457DRAFT_492967 [Linnemannia elongata AG-77]
MDGTSQFFLCVFLFPSVVSGILVFSRQVNERFPFLVFSHVSVLQMLIIWYLSPIIANEN